MRRGVLALSLLLAALAAVPAGASAVTFGANLAREPNSSFTCFELQVIPSYPTCSVQSTSLTTGESSFPPAGEGIVSVVRVRVGPNTGPMRIVEEEALRKDNPADPGHPIYACCRAVAFSPVFTPTPNTVTTVPVDFRVKQSLTPEPSGYYIDDHFSLSVLNAAVPVPLNLDGDPNTALGGWFPAWQTVGEERASPFGIGTGATVLFNADWNPVAGAAPGGGGESAPIGPVRLPEAAIPPPLTVPVPLTTPALARVRNGQALVPLTCNLDSVCRGLLRLQSRRAGGAARLFARNSTGRHGKGMAHGKRGKRRRTITFAASGFRIAAGKKQTLRAALKKAGRRLLARHPRAKVWLNVTLKGTSETVPSRKLTLKRAARGRKKKR